MTDKPGSRPAPVVADRSVLLIHSPLVGPSTMTALASAMARRGFTVAAPDLTAVADQPTAAWRWFVEQAADSAGRLPSVIVIGHSGAGTMLPAIGRRLIERLSALLFVDAVVPPEKGFHRTSEELAAMLDRQTTDGRLARWLGWWPPEVIESLLPDPADRATLAADMPQLPRRFYAEDVPVPDRWSSLPCGYIQLSGAYERDRRAAEERGWPTATIDSSHLGIHTEPERVAEAIGAMADRLAR